METEKKSQTKVVSLNKKLKAKKRLEHLQALIESGQYEVSSRLIAESLLTKDSLGADPDTIEVECAPKESEKNSKK